MFYILSKYYDPNTATTNHALSFMKGFSEMGVQAEWVFIIPNARQALWEKPYRGISVRYLWNKLISKNRLTRYIYMHIRYAFFYFFTLKEGDTILVMFADSFLHRLVRRRGINVYHERTEHPDAYPMSKYKWVRRNFVADSAKSSGFFVISNALKTYFEKEGLSQGHVHVINMVVDANRFYGLKKDDTVEPYIAYCGNASNSKDGVDNLIRAFAIVAKKYSNIKLYIIGKAPSTESDNHQLVKSLGIENRIVFTGIVPAEKMPQLLMNAKMLALFRPESLQNTYGFPTKLGEYLLTGNPVVITRIGDIPLFLEHKKSALMSNCGDVQTFANNIEWVINNPEASQEIGLRGKEIAEKNFNYFTETEKMYKVMFPDKK